MGGGARHRRGRGRCRQATVQGQQLGRGMRFGARHDGGPDKRARRVQPRRRRRAQHLRGSDVRQVGGALPQIGAARSAAARPPGRAATAGDGRARRQSSGALISGAMRVLGTRDRADHGQVGPRMPAPARPAVRGPGCRLSWPRPATAASGAARAPARCLPFSRAGIDAGIARPPRRHRAAAADPGDQRRALQPAVPASRSSGGRHGGRACPARQAPVQRRRRGSRGRETRDRAASASARRGPATLRRQGSPARTSGPTMPRTLLALARLRRCARW